MPLKVTPASGDVRVDGDGVMPVTAPAGRLVPLLVWDEKTVLDVRVNGHPQALAVRPLAADEALVGQFERPFFKAPMLQGRKVIPVRLNAADFLARDALAWDALDAIVFDDMPADDVAAALLACGVTLMASHDLAMTSRLPWQRYLAGYRIIATTAGPSDATADEAWYEPTSAWPPGRPAVTRRLALLAAVVVALGATALMLLRRGPAAVIAFSLVAAGAIAFWPALAVKTTTARGVIRVERAGCVTRTDTLTYFLDSRGGPAATESTALIYPLASSPAHLATLAPALRVNDHDATLTVTLTHTSRAGVIERQIMSEPASASLPTRTLAVARYRADGFIVTDGNGVTIMRDR